MNSAFYVNDVLLSLPQTQSDRQTQFSNMAQIVCSAGFFGAFFLGLHFCRVNIIVIFASNSFGSLLQLFVFFSHYDVFGVPVMMAGFAHFVAVAVASFLPKIEEHYSLIKFFNTSAFA